MEGVLFLYSMNKALLQHLSASLEADIISVEAVHGGDINKSYCLQTWQRQLFLKCNGTDHPDLFETELKGVELLRQANAIYIPEPLLHGRVDNTIFLLMEFISKGDPQQESWHQLAASLAALHRNTQPLFGLDHSNFIGTLRQSNTTHESWSAFYANERILPLIRQAYDNRQCDKSDTTRAERLCLQLDNLFPNEAPALLHGDLWSGNFLFDRSGAAVIFDPAVYYGHREMDLGMSLLFGGFDTVFYSFYHEHNPLENGWKERVPLTQLYPLLVHLLLFGGHYHQNVRDILKRYAG